MARRNRILLQVGCDQQAAVARDSLALIPKDPLSSNKSAPKGRGSPEYFRLSTNWACYIVSRVIDTLATTSAERSVNADSLHGIGCALKFQGFPDLSARIKGRLPVTMTLWQHDR